MIPGISEPTTHALLRFHACARRTTRFEPVPGLRGLLSCLQCGNGLRLCPHICASAERSAMPDSNPAAPDCSAVLQLTGRVAALETELAALRRKINAQVPKVCFASSL